MLKLNMRNIYIDKDWVAQQYLNMERNKEWNEMETMNDEKVAELELLWCYADDHGIPVDDLQLADGNDSKDNENIQADDVETEPIATLAKIPNDVHSSATSNDSSTELDTSKAK
jgi:hypothetical protein